MFLLKNFMPVISISFAVLFIFVTMIADLRAEPVSLSTKDEAMLDAIQEKSLEFFIREGNPRNGLIPDKANNFSKGATKAASSIAAVGFALSAYPVGVERGWLSYNMAYELTRRTLRFFLNEMPHKNGFFYHFVNMKTGERVGRSELSSIDTALFLAGALFAAEYFDKPEVRDLAAKLYERVDFEWMLNGKKTLSMAWSPESGFNRRHWDHYDESMILYLLAIGSPAHSIPAGSWQEISRPVGSYGGFRVIQMPPLFTHQYSHIWIDFRDKNDGYADYFQNSVNAALANRAYCVAQSSKYETYGANVWGLTASDGPFGYKAYGAPPGWALDDGTIAPTGCGSSIVFTPEESLACLRHLFENYQDRLWGLYGFSDAFNLDKNWFSTDVIGIDVGPLLLMIENYRTGLIWEVMSRNTHLKKAMDAVGFKPGTKDIPWPDPPIYEAPYVAGGMQIDGYLRDWSYQAEPIVLNADDRENGYFKDEKDLTATIRFAWDENFLYFSAKVDDDSVILKKSQKYIWMDDALELFLDPQNDGLKWGNSKDFQLGFRANEEGGITSWAWFQEKDPVESGMVQAAGFKDENGYILEGAIRWHALGIVPGSGVTIGAAPAIHDMDRDRSEGKVQWFFRNEGEDKQYNLGRLILIKPESDGAL